MLKLRQHHHGPLVLTLAMLCAGGKVCAQDNAPKANAPLATILDSKEATSLLMEKSAPEYPPVAKVNYIQGLVEVELTVDDRGKVASAHVLEGNAMLAASALKAIGKWIYHPLLTPTGAAGFITTVRVKFALQYRGGELTPQQAEQDFLRQVKPPQVAPPPGDAHSQDTVHVRLLVDEQGQVVDNEVSPTGRAQSQAARETLRNWAFHPAHWGNLPIASYLQVDVPISTTPVARAAVSLGSR